MKNNFINQFYPCFLGFNSKHRTSSQIIAKVLIFANFASTHSGFSNGRFFTVSFKYRIFNRKIFVMFLYQRWFGFTLENIRTSGRRPDNYKVYSTRRLLATNSLLKNNDVKFSLRFLNLIVTQRYYSTDNINKDTSSLNTERSIVFLDADTDKVEILNICKNQNFRMNP